jgi:hypothetical protein
VIADVFLAGVAASRRREQATGYVRRFLSKRKGWHHDLRTSRNEPHSAQPGAGNKFASLRSHEARRDPQ